MNLPLPGSVTNVTPSGVTLFNVYPNPNSGNFTVNMISGYDENVHLTISNIAGEKIQEMEMTTNTVNNITLKQPAGMYILDATTAHGKYSTKITITQ